MMASEPPNPRKKRADKLRIGVIPRESQAGTYLLIARLERAATKNQKEQQPPKGKQTDRVLCESDLI